MKRSKPLARTSGLARGKPMASRSATKSRETPAWRKLPPRPRARPGEGDNGAEKRHKAALAQLGCMLCRRLFSIQDGPVELHHRRTGGWGKGDYTTLIPLCYEHHRGDTGVHGLGTKGFVAHYGITQQELLDDALSLLGATP